jgi:DNA-binding HxlR family transcriptional regulator
VRSYHEYCAIAKSLDVIGDRWTLLVVRELAMRGKCRYTDLRNGLPGIATNLLADRLRELERAGVVAREEAPPPIASTLFSLTERGEQLRPVLDGLMRWGVPLMTERKPEDEVRSHWLAGALATMLVDLQPDQPPITILLQIGEEPIVIETRDGGVETRLGTVPAPDLTLSGEPTPVLGFLLGRLDLAAAKAAGVELTGSPKAIARLGGDAFDLAGQLAQGTL